MDLFKPNTKSVNETAIVNLPSGENAFDITNARLHRPNGKPDIMVAMDFKDANGSYSHFFTIGGEGVNETRVRIGQEALKGVWDASGLSGNANIDRLPQFVGKKVRLKVEVSSQKDNEGNVKHYANIKGAWPVKAAEAPAGPVHDPEDGLEGIDPVEPAVADTTGSPPPSAPAPAATSSVVDGQPVRKTWKPKK